MKTKKFCIVVIVLTITTSAIAFSKNGTFTSLSLSQLLFPSISKADEAVLDKNSKDKNSKDKNQQPSSLRIKENSQTAAQKSEDVPDNIVYFILFHHLVSLKKESVKVAALGKNLNYLGMYENQATLDNTQSLFLFDIAEQCMEEIKIIDEQARQIVVKERMKFKELKSKDDEIPPPAPELVELQKKKDETVLKFRDQFRDFLGEGRFSQFNDFAHQKIAPQVTKINKEEDK